jgi:site-specific DNA recombinase
MGEIRTVRCAIYTRTSSDENLLQDYNSLAAQRDSCAAYILSQRHEGWVRVRKNYDDGGFSGGTMERPALRELLADLAAREVDMVVVYKIDRLTRSLRDFSRLSETLDRFAASFVAVTQQFNTASSMGRLTLNVLLTFAQFEREVAGDRIRDKIASSKRLGIWMGGQPPIGYDAPNKKLVVNLREAEVVRYIYRRFVELQSMAELRLDLEKNGIVSKMTVREDGSIYGGKGFSWHPITTILTNPVYRGMVRHKEAVYPGRHEPIVEKELFDHVQKLVKQVADREKAKRQRAYPSLLRGMIFATDGDPLYRVQITRGPKRYNYYTSSTLLHRNLRRTSINNLRFPAPALEAQVINLLCSSLRDRRWIVREFSTGRLNAPAAEARELASEVEGQLQRISGILQKLIRRIEVDSTTLQLFLDRKWLCDRLGVSTKTSKHLTNDPIKLVREGHGVRCRNAVRAILEGPAASLAPDHRLVRGILRATRWYVALSSGEYGSMDDLADAEGCCPTLITNRIGLAFLAPDIVEAIFEGRQPPSLTLAKIKKLSPLPFSWSEQRLLLLKENTHSTLGAVIQNSR